MLTAPQNFQAGAVAPIIVGDVPETYEFCQDVTDIIYFRLLILVDRYSEFGTRFHLTIKCCGLMNLTRFCLARSPNA